ncbi:MAG: hypothetical protein EOO43_14965, partial [Flavobacterium sp.]
MPFLHADLQNVSASSTQVKRSLSLTQRNELLSGRVLIGYKGTLTNQKISDLKNKYGLELKFDIKKIKTAVFESKGIQAKATISQMKNDKDLTYVGEDQAPRIDDDIKPVQVSIKDASGDPLRKDQWSLDKVEAEKAWGISKGKGVIIGIVDTGVDLEHVDLKANLLKGYNAEDDGATPPQDGGSHGTHCAGIAAAVGNNGEGMSGIAPEAKILPVRAITKGGVPEVARGIVWAVDNGAKVISLSLGWDYPSEAVIETIGKALKYGLDKNVVFTCALSNSSTYNPQSVPDNFASKPGFEGVIGVGNINITDGKMGASGEWKSISAPGTNIISTIPGSKWGTKTGTSTNENGFYRIKVPNTKAILTFSMLSFKTVEALVGNRVKIDIILPESAETNLNEIVIVGYGAIKRRDVSGAIVSVNAEDISKRMATNIAEALQGQVAGVQISTGSGQPGEGASVVIRGMSTMN